VSSGAAALHVVGIVADDETRSLLERTVNAAGDALTITATLADGLARVSAEVPDIALVDVALGQNAGLAVIHHIRALAPQVAIYALTQQSRLELGSAAMALGATGVLVMPLTGDDVLTALTGVRARRAEQAHLREVEHRADVFRLESRLLARVAELAECETRREASERLLVALAEAGARRALVYLPAGEGARELLRAAASPPDASSPAFCEELELLAYAEKNGFRVVRLALRRELGGVLLVDGLLDGLAHEVREAALSTLAAQCATTLGLIAAREDAYRGGMKDPRSSAYTFAYFVDVAGREIDMARRHRRRFALATISVHPRSAAAPEGVEPTLAAVEHVLGAVRDTDVLARVDANEFYLLLPETNGLGAHACRRRVLDRLLATPEGHAYETGVGVAVYPHDGGDLSRLLRAARHRAEVCRVSVVERLGLRALGLGAIVDALLAEPPGRTGAAPGVEAPRVVELPTTDVVGLVLSAVREASRGGPSLVVLTRHAGVGIGGTLTGDAGRAGAPRQMHAVDVSQAPGCANVEVCALVSEQGTYAFAGRVEGHCVRAVHAADPLLADLLIQRLGQASGARLGD
jgi:ActR/RegA family two-component response regulator/GGDEF domain-containing protein